MRRESSTVVVLVGEVGEGLLAELARSANVSVARAPDTADAGQSAVVRPGWEPGAMAMREAARRASTYVIVSDDPLAGLAAGWRAMWDPSAGPGGAVGFEERAADALAAWRDKRFDLPDYYLVSVPYLVTEPAQSADAVPDLYLGPLRAVRPRRVAVVPDAESRPDRVTAALRSLRHGPWWPPLDELIDAARRFYPGHLPEVQAPPA
jgi:hypothetical protein